MTQSLREAFALDSGVLQAVDRATAELRRGGLLVIFDREGQAALVQAAEGATPASLPDMARLTGCAPLLLLTRQRAGHLGLRVPGAPGEGGSPPAADVVAVGTAGMTAETVAELADPTARQPSLRGAEDLARWPLTAPAETVAGAAVGLAKIARLLPAALFARLANVSDPKRWAQERTLLAVSAENVEDYRFAAARSLSIVAAARVPLAAAEETRIVAFRPSDGGVEHLALVIGSPKADEPVLTRLHSECFTGDLLGSLRCDCGDQLRGAIQAIAEAGSGVLLYLAQEGRGIGLVNKLRAYTLQDLGADTFEANEQLGFDADERIYLPAAEMLRRLGFDRVRLLTNNPDKMAGLARCGIAVEDRVAHSFPSNGHNELYLAAKASRGGHLF